jgi:hypothetical protein
LTAGTRRLPPAVSPIPATRRYRLPEHRIGNDRIFHGAWRIFTVRRNAESINSLNLIVLVVSINTMVLSIFFF